MCKLKQGWSILLYLLCVWMPPKASPSDLIEEFEDSAKETKNKNTSINWNESLSKPLIIIIKIKYSRFITAFITNYIKICLLSKKHFNWKVSFLKKVLTYNYFHSLEVWVKVLNLQLPLVFKILRENQIYTCFTLYF